MWLNLIADIVATFALALDPSTPDAMQRPPRNPKDTQLSAGFAKLIVWQGVLLSAVTLPAFKIGIHRHGADSAGLRRATTLVFMTLTLSQVVHALNTRSRTQSIFSGNVFSNRGL